MNPFAPALTLLVARLRQRLNRAKTRNRSSHRRTIERFESRDMFAGDFEVVPNEGVDLNVAADISAIAVGEKIYFQKSDAVYGNELFVHDPTTDSFDLVADLNPGAADSFPGRDGFALVDDRLYFSAIDAEFGHELRWIDTTLTSPIVHTIDINIGPAHGFADGSMNLNKVDRFLYFVAKDASGISLMRMLDTTDASETVQAIAGSNSVASYYNEKVIQANGKVFFTRYVANSGIHVSWSDVGSNSVGGTVNERLNETDSNFMQMVGDRIYFGTNRSDFDLAWIDTIAPSTTPNYVAVGNASEAALPGDFGGFTTVSNYLFFTAKDSSLGIELHVLDTTAMTEAVRLIEINPGANDAFSFNFQRSLSFTVVDRQLYFVATDAVHGTELRKIDTRDGNLNVVTFDYKPGIANAFPSRLKLVEKFNESGSFYIYFEADGPEGQYHMRRIDVSANTNQIESVDMPPYSGRYLASKMQMLPYQDRVYFVARKFDHGSPVRYGIGYITQSASTGFTKISDVMYQATSWTEMIGAGNGRMLYRPNDNSFFRLAWVDTNAGTTKPNYVNMSSFGVADYFQTGGTAIIGDRIFFTGNSGSQVTLCWFDTRTTEFGTIAALGELPRNYKRGALHAIGTKLFFVANDDAHGLELRWVDVTQANPIVNTIDIAVGNASSYPAIEGFHSIGNRLFFAASDSTYGRELRHIDVDQLEIIVSTIDFTQGPASTTLASSGFASYGSKLFFNVLESSTNTNRFSWLDSLLVQPSIRRVRGRDGVDFSNAGATSGFAIVGTNLFFSAATVSGNNVELFRINASTAQPIANLIEIYSGYSSSDPGKSSGLYAVGNRLFFSAKTAEHGNELRWIDGTSSRPLVNTIDIVPGADSSFSEYIEFANPGYSPFLLHEDLLYFIAKDPITSSSREELKWIDTRLDSPSVGTIEVNAGPIGGLTLMRRMFAANGRIFLNAIKGDLGGSIVVVGRDRGPTDVLLSSNSILENQSSGLVIGSLGTVAPTTNDQFTYRLTYGVGADHNAMFRIEGNDLVTATSFDFESRNTHSIRVRTTDSTGRWFEKQLLIKVVNSPDVPNVFVIDSTYDYPDVNPGDGLAIDKTGRTSLRAAIMEANASPNSALGNDRIEAYASSTTWFHFTVDTPLPSITEAVTIDGGTPTNGIKNFGIAQFWNAVFTGPILRIRASGTEVKNIAIVDASFGAISVENVSNVRIENNYIGLNRVGATRSGEGYGIKLSNASNSLIENNSIVTRAGVGIDIVGRYARYNQVFGNRIGIGVNGNVAVGSLRYGIAIRNGSENVIGGSAAGQGNLISSASVGVVVSGTQAARNRVFGNTIGQPKSIPTGVLITNGANNNRIERFQSITASKIKIRISTLAGSDNVLV
jgi:ELWxxDGT repeat protein